jgi:hypothetical protein
MPRNRAEDDNDDDDDDNNNVGEGVYLARPGAASTRAVDD